MTREEVEKALDRGQLYAEMNDGRWWKARRNGRTQTWKTRPGEFRIPIKVGLRIYGNVTQDNLAHFEIRS